MSERNPITTDVLHIYAQAMWHGEARIAGTRDELDNLIAAIQLAVKRGKATMRTYCIDGEGYDLNINCVIDATNLPVPYTDEMAQASTEAHLKAPWRLK
jgi:hypothetical protein